MAALANDCSQLKTLRCNRVACLLHGRGSRRGTQACPALHCRRRSECNTHLRPEMDHQSHSQGDHKEAPAKRQQQRRIAGASTRMSLERRIGPWPQRRRERTKRKTCSALQLSENPAVPGHGGPGLGLGLIHPPFEPRAAVSQVHNAGESKPKLQMRHSAVSRWSLWSSVSALVTLVPAMLTASNGHRISSSAQHSGKGRIHDLTTRAYELERIKHPAIQARLPIARRRSRPRKPSLDETLKQVEVLFATTN